MTDGNHIFQELLLLIKTHCSSTIHKCEANLNIGGYTAFHELHDAFRQNNDGAKNKGINRGGAPGFDLGFSLTEPFTHKINAEKIPYVRTSSLDASAVVKVLFLALGHMPNSIPFP